MPRHDVKAEDYFDRMTNAQLLDNVAFAKKSVAQNTEDTDKLVAALQTTEELPYFDGQQAALEIMYAAIGKLTVEIRYWEREYNTLFTEYVRRGSNEGEAK